MRQLRRIPWHASARAGSRALNRRSAILDIAPSIALSIALLDRTPRSHCSIALSIARFNRLVNSAVFGPTT
jgi:hypothetical protein